MTEPINPRPKRDRTNENFLRATKNIMHRGDEMSRRYGADIYIVLRCKGRYYDYCSTQDTSFPTPPIELVRRPEPEACPLLTLKQEKTYPLPVRRTPASFERQKYRPSEKAAKELSDSN